MSQNYAAAKAQIFTAAKCYQQTMRKRHKSNNNNSSLPLNCYCKNNNSNNNCKMSIKAHDLLPHSSASASSSSTSYSTAASNLPQCLSATYTAATKTKTTTATSKALTTIFNCLNYALPTFLFYLLICLICSVTLSNGAPTTITTTTTIIATAAAAASNQQHFAEQQQQQQYHSSAAADLQKWHNFTDLEAAASAMDLMLMTATGDDDDEKIVNAIGEIEGFNAESSLALSDTKSSTGCPATTSSHCLRCNNAGCIKCSMYLVTDTRQCVEQCPSGYIDQWSAHTEFMGRVCISTGYSGPLLAALAGLLGGFIVCLSLLGMAVLLMRRRRRRKLVKHKLINEHSVDRADFLRQLNDMRPNAEYFLAMLNDTRRQIRKLYLSGEAVAANSYRPIVRDLAKILLLLNRPIELIPEAPRDWHRLYAWAEQALERYKPQVGQLIDFLQAAPGMLSRDDFDAASTYKQQKGSANIFRQSATSSSSMAAAAAAQKLHLFGSLISLHEFEEPRATDPFGSSFNTLKSGNLISDLNASSLWLEDEFYKLGFRPQDEITTEL